MRAMDLSTACSVYSHSNNSIRHPVQIGRA
jgi:hypothetical protein